MRAEAINRDQVADWLDEAVAEFAETRDPALRDQIVERGAWLARRVARRFAETSEPFDDLCQVAMIGLLKAVDRYDPKFGVRFGTFATPTILGELRRHFRDHTWAVHVPRGAKELRIQINGAVDEMTADLGHSPTVAELAERLDLQIHGPQPRGQRDRPVPALQRRDRFLEREGRRCAGAAVAQPVERLARFVGVHCRGEDGRGAIDGRIDDAAMRLGVSPGRGHESRVAHRAQGLPLLWDAGR